MTDRTAFVDAARAALLKLTAEELATLLAGFSFYKETFASEVLNKVAKTPTERAGMLFGGLLGTLLGAAADANKSKPLTPEVRQKLAPLLTCSECEKTDGYLSKHVCKVKYCQELPLRSLTNHPTGRRCPKCLRSCARTTPSAETKLEGTVMSCWTTAISRRDFCVSTWRGARPRATQTARSSCARCWR